MNVGTFFSCIKPRIPYGSRVAPVEEMRPGQHSVLSWPNLTAEAIGIRRGSSIRTGQNIAVSNYKFLVSPVTGILEKIESYRGPDGRNFLAMTIERFAQDEYDESLRKIPKPLEMSREALLTAIARTGCECLDLVRAGVRPKAVVLSAMDRDPMSHANRQALRDGVGQVAEAMAVLKRATGIEELTLALSADMADLKPDLADVDGVIKMVRPVYPNGLPEMVAWHQGGGALMRPVPEGVLGDVLVVSAECMLGIVNSLKTGTPRMNKIVTFADADGKTANLRVRLGTPVADILAERDVQFEANWKLIVNGNMRGHACYSDQYAISNYTDSVHVQRESDIYIYQEAPCTNCGRCTEICPVNLDVHLIGRFAEYNLIDRCQKMGVENCIDCGLCGYVCPSRRALVQFIAHAKRELLLGNLSENSMEEALSCGACGPSCPSLRLFDDGKEEKT